MTKRYQAQKKYLYTFQGRTERLSVWARILGIGYTTLRKRIIYDKWPIKKAFTTPPGETRKSKNPWIQCGCGCGTLLKKFGGNGNERKYIVLHRPPRPNEIIICGCGCGRSMEKFDRQHRVRKFIVGHNFRHGSQLRCPNPRGWNRLSEEERESIKRKLKEQA